MLQKFALAFKTKTIEFFADDEKEEDDEDKASISAAIDLDPGPEEIITGQRVVVLKPDPLPPPRKPDPETLILALFATISSFRAAYLHLQTAHSPLLPDAVRFADRAAVSHLRRLSDLKDSYFQNPNPSPRQVFSFSSHLQAQVQENQHLLRTFDAVVNRLQSDIDRKDAESAALKRSLWDIEAANSKLAKRLDRACAPPDGKVEALLSIGVFDSVLKDTCRVVHRFTRCLVDLMKRSGWSLDLVANSIYPNVDYAKAGHCPYAILSYIYLGMFRGFDSEGFSREGSDGIGLDGIDVNTRRMNSLTQFIEHSAVDPLELISGSSSCDFAKFCERKYRQLIHPGMESTLCRNSDHGESVWGTLWPSSPLYEPFVNMASSIWTLHKLAWAYDPVVEIFQVAGGTEFSMVYMESIVRGAVTMGSDHGKKSRPKVGFTVVPGFRVGKTVIQSRVYLNGLKEVVQFHV
ncbi:protein GRAVITROPIC IN THE LIGHT 1 [Elaeis guineensis]|uniref:Protein GRAVITROPIC IN THE LIGHT 1 n=1 Tax=Elaeis guineensis var. tenera TaxID=51953 RepID=A0A6I9R8Y5_ELAGV|nr:protein GRAVITROPIC IN THE LIGHT 1 [Elaeis guineensis]